MNDFIRPLISTGHSNLQPFCRTSHAVSTALDQVEEKVKCRMPPALMQEIRFSTEEKIHHLADRMLRIDLDDCVKHNYKLFADVLAKIK